MAISFVGSGTKVATLSSATTFTFSTELFDASNTAGPTLLADDWVYVVVGKGHTGTAISGVVVSGYTNIAQDYGNDTNDISHFVYRKKMGATPDTTLTLGASANQQAICVFVLRGLDTTTPEDATPVTTNGINGGQADPPSITPVTAGAWILATGGGALNAALNQYTGLTGFSSTTNHFRRVATAAATFIEMGAALKTDWTSGAVDPPAFSGTANTSANSGWAALTMALKPASGVTSTGLVASSEASDAPAASGTNLNHAAGAVTDTGGTPSATGSVSISGSSARTEAPDTSTAVGTTGLTGSVAVTEGANTASAGGSVQASGSASPSEAGDSASAAGTAGDLPIAGTSSASEADDTAAVASTVGISGILAANDNDDTAAGEGSLTTPITGNAAVIEEGDDPTASGLSRFLKLNAYSVNPHTLEQVSRPPQASAARPAQTSSARPAQRSSSRPANISTRGKR